MDLKHIAANAYAKQSRANDKTGHGRSPHLTAQRAVQDALLHEQHRQFDLSAQDKHAKYERAHFAVVGEGAKASQDAYRRNYSLIDWSA